MDVTQSRPVWMVCEKCFRNVVEFWYYRQVNVAQLMTAGTEATLYTSIRHLVIRLSHTWGLPRNSCLSVCHSWHSHICQPIRHFPASPRRKSRHAAPSVRHLKHCQAFCFTTDRSQIFTYTNSPQISMLMESIYISLSFCVITYCTFNRFKQV